MHFILDQIILNNRGLFLPTSKLKKKLCILLNSHNNKPRTTQQPGSRRAQCAPVFARISLHLISQEQKWPQLIAFVFTQLGLI